VLGDPRVGGEAGVASVAGLQSVCGLTVGTTHMNATAASRCVATITSTAATATAAGQPRACYLPSNCPP